MPQTHESRLCLSRSGRASESPLDVSMCALSGGLTGCHCELSISFLPTFGILKWKNAQECTVVDVGAPRPGSLSYRVKELEKMLMETS